MTDRVTPAVGDELLVEVARPAAGGEFIAHADGRVVFVAGVLPGERARVRVTQAKKNFLRADLIAVETASAQRVAGQCEAAAQGAGCCDFDHVDPAAAGALKVDTVLDCLRRLGRVDTVPQPHTMALEPATGWRTRVRLGVDAAGQPGHRRRGGTEVLGGVPCAQVDPRLQEAVFAHGPYTPGAEVVGAIDSGGEIAIVQVARPPRGQRARTIVQAVTGPRTLTQQVAGHDFSVAAIGFWQAHVAAAETYSALLREWLTPILAETTGAVVGWDLFGGVGVFAHAILDAARAAGADADAAEVHVVDSEPGTAGDPRIVMHGGDCAAVVPQLPAASVVVCDPPRQGAGRAVVEAVAARAPRAVVHVGCDPATFARDIAAWRDGGYVLKELCVIDAFPSTHHSETFALLVPAT
ncbi:RNA methyltransferase [Corynebacterium sp. 13CS0277]|uniref:class I SAM-dependent RNA methyltransferase n=1 Tax=Corynebacterium sp. 13CS0277 TaxID=2071994 RepID=UPI000D042797|nr:TRAM domain-containing protein [Corynebacterium sp. 13CS0277]PRQ10352.1 RNA methyltransferase [Corynebacterium sp. 13CS0277]